MFPVLHLGIFHIPMYTLMVILGAVAYYITFRVIVKKEKIARRTADRLLLVSILGFIVLYLSAFIFNSIFHSIEKKKLTVGGITWLGGVLGAVPFTLFAIHKLVPKARGNALYYFSLILPGLVIAHGLGRLGCFFGGCCYGGVTDSIFGVSFPAGSSAANKYPASPGGPSLPVLPTQLFEAVFEILLYVVMLLLRFRKEWKGYNIEIYCISYGVFRFVLEFFRGDDRGGTGLGLSPSQIMSIVLLIGAACLILFRNRLIFKKLYAKCEVWREKAALYDDTAPLPAKRNPLDEIKQLHSMMEEGILTKEEFEEKKTELLKRL